MEILEFLVNNYYAATILVFITLAFCMLASVNVKSTFSKYSKTKSKSGVPAYMIARQILDSNGLYNIEVIQTRGKLTDHYDPKKKIIALSDDVYNSTSVSAIGVAAHECGHAVQHGVNYFPIQVRTAFFPVVNIASRSWFLLFLLGMAFSFSPLVNIGIVFFAAVAFFQLITLPVEFDASNRAMQTIAAQNILAPDEQVGAKKTLNAAAMTYVAALINSIAQLIRLIAMTNRRR